jgi:hypothetical protein
LKIIGGLVAGITVAVTLLIAAFLFWPRGGVESYDFDSAAWKRSLPTKGDETRLFMVDDLLDEHPLIGHSRHQVVELLGEPDSTPYFKNFEMVYFLGRERRVFGLDSEWLVLKMPQGTVVEARVVTD